MNIEEILQYLSTSLNGEVVISKEILTDYKTPIVREIYIQKEFVVRIEFNDYGLQLGRLYIENISLPKAVQKTIDEQTGMNVIGDNMNNYAKFQTAKGMANASDGNNMASAGIGMAMGMEMAKSMASSMTNDNQNKQDNIDNSEPPPPPIYYLMLSGERKGPLPLNKVLHYLETGEADTDTLIWRKGMPQWTTVGQCGEIDTSAFPPPIK